MTTYQSSEGDTVDLIAWKQYGTHDGRTVEQLLDANPGLADYGPILPTGVLVALPKIEAPATSRGVRLWD